MNTQVRRQRIASPAGGGPSRPADIGRGRNTSLTAANAVGIVTPSAVLALEVMRAKEQNTAIPATSIDDAIDEALEWARRP